MYIAQWPEAPAAPTPVSERTNWAGKAARSFAACAPRAISETSEMTAKAEVIEKIGPMRNKTAAEQGSEVRRERRGRRG